MFTYMVTLVLRNDDDGVWESEWFPKDGYGFFLCFMYAIVIPAPTIYFFFKERKPEDKMTQGVSEADHGAALFENPLTPDDEEQSSVPVFENATGGNAPAQQTARTLSQSKPKPTPMKTHVALAKLQRVSKQNIDQNKDLVIQNQDLLEKNELLSAENRQMQTTNDGKTRLGADMDSASPLQLESDGRNFEGMKALVTDDTLTQDVRDAAKQSLDAHVLDIIDRSTQERQIRAKQQALDSKLASVTVSIEHHAKQANIARKQESVLHDELEGVKLRNAGAFTVAMTARTSLREWLGEHRLIGHEQAFVDIGGRDVAVSDLRFLRPEDVDMIGTDMSCVPNCSVHCIL